MMNRCWAVFLRYFYLFTKLDQIADLLYWPAIDIVLWGVTTVWIQHNAGTPNIALIVMTGLIFWQIVWRGNYEISVNLLQEFWNRNLVNLFSTPLRIREWIGGVLLLCLCKIGIALAFGVIATAQSIAVVISPLLAGFIYNVRPDLIYRISLIGIAVVFTGNYLILPRLREAQSHTSIVANEPLSTDLHPGTS